MFAPWLLILHNKPYLYCLMPHKEQMREDLAAIAYSFSPYLSHCVPKDHPNSTYHRHNTVTMPILEDKGFAIAALKNNINLYYYLPDNLKRDASVLDIIDEKKYLNKDIVLLFITCDVMKIKSYLSDNEWNTKDIFLKYCS